MTKICSGVFGAMRWCATAGLIGWMASACPAGESRLSPLAPQPDWSALDAFQKTITRAEFEKLLGRVYAPGDAARRFLVVGDETAVLRTGDGERFFTLHFARAASAAAPVGRYWRTAREHGRAPDGKPLDGVRIAIDPGHIGGKWAKIEERWFQIGRGTPVTEGDMTLVVSRHLKNFLGVLGAEVMMVREGAEPLTGLRPKDLKEEAREWLRERGIARPKQGYNGPNDPSKGSSVDWNAELLFYRISEIRERADRVNDRIRPDVTVCVHFNAEDWGDPARPSLVSANHLHLLLNGRYGADELKYEDQRFDMMMKLLGRSWPEELAISKSVAGSLAKSTGLKPYVYRGGNAIRVAGSQYLWVRNLLANRLYRCPVVYLEPYVMNSRDVHARIQAGDYQGWREVAGIRRESIFREYARGVAEGLADYYRGARRGSVSSCHE